MTEKCLLWPTREYKMRWAKILLESFEEEKVLYKFFHSKFAWEETA